MTPAAITQKGKDLFAHMLEPDYGGKGRDLELIEVCSLLNRHAVTYHRIQETLCSVELSNKQKRALEKREESIERRIRTLALEIDEKIEPLFTGDPRGYCVRFLLPSGRHNTWGGKESGWGFGE